MQKFRDRLTSFPSPLEPPLHHGCKIRFDRVALALRGVAVFLGGLGWLGWVTHNPALTSLQPGFATMKVNTALCLVGLGLALGGSRRLFGLTVLVGLTALLTLSQDLLGWQAGIDELLFRDAASAVNPGRMSPSTALCLCLLSLGAGLLRTARPERVRLRESSAVIALTVSGAAMMGYLFDAPALYRVLPFSTIALPTAIALTCLGLALLAGRADQGWMRLICSQTAAGSSCRRLLPFLLLLPVGLGYLRWLGQQHGLYGTEFGLAIYSLSNVLCLTALSLWHFRGMQVFEQSNLQMLRELTELEVRTRADQRLRSFNESLREAVIAADSQGRVVDWNGGAQSMFGWARPEVLGRSFRSLLAPSQDLASLPPLPELLGTTLEVRALRADGAEFPAEVSLSGWSSSEGSFYSALVRDVSERHQREQTVQRFQQMLEADRAALTEALARAESASYAKSEFLATVSHELRTPLNAIIGFGEMLQSEAMGPLNSKQQRYSKNIVDSGRHLLDLIGAILEYSKLEAGKLELQLHRADLATIIEGSLELLHESAAIKKLELRVQVAPNLPPLRCDSLRLRQVLINLVGNAIKFTEAGTITVAARQEGERLVVEVSDTGVGIAPQDQERIFERFEQVDNSFSRVQQGTGLGLALVRELVRLHGGQVWLKSAPGQGSTFGFWLPLGDDLDQGGNQVPAVS